MNTPKPIDLNAETPTLPENVNFFKVITSKMHSGKAESICFNDVLFCEKSKIETPGYFVLTKDTGNKLGIIRDIDKDGNFVLESNPKDKKLFPNYTYNLAMFDEVYSLSSLSRDRLFIADRNENEDWDNFNDVIEWQPETIEDRITYRHNILKYLENN